MSSTVIIIYKTRQVKVKCNPGTLIREIKTNACNFLQLDADKFDLKHGKDILASSTPFRLCNIVGNAKIELIPAKKRAENALVKVRLQVVDLPSDYSSKLIDDFPSNTSIWNILKTFEKRSGINFTQRSYKKMLKKMYEVPTIQLFNTVLTRLDQLDDTLHELGIDDGTISMKVRFEKTELSLDQAIAFQKKFNKTIKKTSKPIEQPTSTINSMELDTVTSTNSKETFNEERTVIDESKFKQPEAEMTDQSTSKSEIDASESDSAKTQEEEEKFSRNIKIYSPSSGNRSIPDDDPGEMNMTQFTQYQQQLKNMADPQPHLMTRSMREKAELEKRDRVKQCTIRVRFPDLTHAEATFRGSETVQELHNFVKSVLRNSEVPFILFVTPPRRELELHERLSYDCKFGPRELVFFEWKVKNLNTDTPILKQELLGSAESMGKVAQAAEERVSTKLGNSSSSNKSKKPFSKPKWMKLSKK